jgi:hypothetical protein
MFSASAVAGDQNSLGRKKGSEAHNFFFFEGKSVSFID